MASSSDVRDGNTDDKLQVRIQTVRRQLRRSGRQPDHYGYDRTYQPHRVDIAKRNSLTDGITNIAGATMSVTGSARLTANPSIRSHGLPSRGLIAASSTCSRAPIPSETKITPAGYTKARMTSRSASTSTAKSPWMAGPRRKTGRSPWWNKPNTNGILLLENRGRRRSRTRRSQIQPDRQHIRRQNHRPDPMDQRWNTEAVHARGRRLHA